jgi:hypothetical protein
VTSRKINTAASAPPPLEDIQSQVDAILMRLVELNERISSLLCELTRQGFVQLVRHFECGFLSACLQVEPSSRITAFASLQKKLFTTHDSTVSANALVTMQSTTQKIERLPALLIEYQQLAEGRSSESLDSRLSDLMLCLSQQIERIR